MLTHTCCHQCTPPQGGAIAGEPLVIPDPAGGYSAGLQYRYVHGHREGTWRVWDRRTGEVAWSWYGSWPVLAERQTAEACDRLNGIRPPTPAEQAELNAAMDQVP